MTGNIAMMDLEEYLQRTAREREAPGINRHVVPEPGDFQRRFRLGACRDLPAGTGRGASCGLCAVCTAQSLSQRRSSTTLAESSSRERCCWCWESLEWKLGFLEDLDKSA